MNVYVSCTIEKDREPDVNVFKNKYHAVDHVRYYTEKAFKSDIEENTDYVQILPEQNDLAYVLYIDTPEYKVYITQEPLKESEET